MPFTPKFIDLVKNSTTVQGTGAVTLGAALSGFTGFASVCVTGDQFYYCIQGIDKPAEREVGRGSMQSDGTISRDAALGGPLKNFTSGTKTIALVAAGEWFAKLETLANAPVSSGGAPTPLFAAAAGSSIAAPIVAISSAGYSVNGVGEARYVQDAAVNASYVTANPRTSFRVADGRGFKLSTEQRLTVQMFGAVPGDSSSGAKAANDAAFKAACEHRATAGSYFGSEIHVGPYTYFLGVTLEPEGAFRLIGQGCGHVNASQAGVAQTRLIFPTDVCPIRVRAGGTDGLGLLAGKIAANDSYIKGINFEQLTMGTNPLAYGMQLRGNATVENCAIVNAPGNGFHLVAETGGSDPVRAGFCDAWRIINCQVHSTNGHGIFIGGNEANAGYTSGLELHQVGGVGIFDTSNFANAHYSPLINGYGQVGERGVFHLGRLYQLVSPNPALGSTTTPGTNVGVWYDLGASATALTNYPQWVSGTNYGLRLSFFILNGSPIYGGYVENGPNIGSSNGLLVGGTIGGITGTNTIGARSDLGLINALGFARYRENGGVTTSLTAPNIGDQEYVAVGAVDTNNGINGRPSILTYRTQQGATSVPSEFFSMDWVNNQDIKWGFGGRTMVTMGGIQSTYAYGTATAKPGVFTLLNYAIGRSDSGDTAGGAIYATAARRQFGMTLGSPPSQGDHAQGEFAWNLYNPGGGILGWSCVGSGTPGTWKAIVPGNPVLTGSNLTSSGVAFDDSTDKFRFAQYSGQYYLQAGTSAGSGGTLNICGTNVVGALNVVCNGTITGTNLSGTNSGDQIITLTGDVTGSGTGSFAATIGANKVGFTKVVAASAASLVGASAAGNFAELTPAVARTVLGLATVATSGLASDLAGTLSGAQTPAFTGDVTKAAGSTTTAIAANAVTFPKIVAATQAAFIGASAAGAFGELAPAASTALLTSMIGANGTIAGTKGLVPAPAATDNAKFLRGDGSWVAVAGGTGTVTSVSVTTANGISGSVATATSTPAITLTLGAITPTSVAATGTVTGSNLSGINSGDQTITLTGDISGTGTGSFATAIGPNKVTNAMLAQVATATFHGRITAATGNVETLTATQATSLLDAVTSTTKGLAPASGGGTANFLRADGSWATPPVGTGTVTSASVVTANGISGSVASATTTPAITLTLGAITPASVAATGAITSSGGGVGYAIGAGGAVTQVTSRTTGVTLSKLSGTITLFSTTTTAGQTTTLTVTNTQVGATDTVVVSQKAGTGLYFCAVTAVVAGSFNLSVYTPAAVATAEAPVLNFALVKGVNA